MNIQINKILPKEHYQMMSIRVNGTIIAPMQQSKHFCDEIIWIKRTPEYHFRVALVRFARLEIITFTYFI